MVSLNKQARDLYEILRYLPFDTAAKIAAVMSNISPDSAIVAYFVTGVIQADFNQSVFEVLDRDRADLVRVCWDEYAQ